jgi:OMF family outer membrane factor
MWRRRVAAACLFLPVLSVSLMIPADAQDTPTGAAAPLPGTIIPTPDTAAPSPDTLYYSEPEVVTAPPLVVARPPLQALISIESNLDPFQLDAEQSKPITLADVVEIALQNNLDIQISGLDRESNKWKLLNAYTKFLPNPHLGFSHYNPNGHIRIPISALGGGSAGPIKVQDPFILAQAGVTYNAFQGGKLLFGALQSRNNYRASRWKYHATANDVLLEATKRYYNLLLAEAILQIRIRAVETSMEQLRLNTDLERDGMATHLDVLQARTQLADDRQNLIEQQISRRNSAIQLAEYLNVNQGMDLQPIDTVVQPVRLIAEAVTAGRLLTLAAENRPELKQFHEQWLAARKGIGIAVAPLLPTVQMSATEYGIGETLTNAKRTVTTPTSLLAPMSLGGSPSTPMTTRVSRQITGLGVLGINANWTFNGIGLTDLTNMQSARMQARQAMLQSNQEVNTVISQVRQAYLNQLSALRRTEENLNRVNSSAEELRLSQLRLKNGLGKNIDVLRAQQDLTNARVQEAQSTIDFDIAQAQLLHDVGMISRANLFPPTPLLFQ